MKWDQLCGEMNQLPEGSGWTTNSFSSVSRELVLGTHTHKLPQVLLLAHEPHTPDTC